MCRFAAYLSHDEILLEAVLVKPENSLIKQSHEARESLHGVNADGFGIAWYTNDGTPEPGIYKSIQPAWNDNNLLHLSKKIKSSCFLAHVRASTVGDVQQNNCHPFYFGSYSLVHNGTIRNFDKYKKRLIDQIDEELFLKIKGNTDSEHFFFLIMHYIKQNYDLESSVQKAIQWVTEIQENCEEFSRINIVITNGEEIMATRFVSKGQKPLSLGYLTEPAAGKTEVPSSLIISSESLEEDARWKEIPENHYIYTNKRTMTIKIMPL